MSCAKTTIFEKMTDGSYREIHFVLTSGFKRVGKYLLSSVDTYPLVDKLMDENNPKPVVDNGKALAGKDNFIFLDGEWYYAKGEHQEGSFDNGEYKVGNYSVDFSGFVRLDDLLPEFASISSLKAILEYSAGSDPIKMFEEYAVTVPKNFDSFDDVSDLVFSYDEWFSDLQTALEENKYDAATLESINHEIDNACDIVEFAYNHNLEPEDLKVFSSEQRMQYLPVHKDIIKELILEEIEEIEKEK